GGGSEIARGAATALDQAGHCAADAPLGADDAPLFLGADAIHFGSGAIHRDINQRWRHVVKGVAFPVMRVVHERLNMVRVAADKTPATIVEAHAVLTAASFGFDLKGARVEREVTA